MTRKLVDARGYTLMELMVTFSVFATLAAIAVPHIDSRRLRINSAQRLVIAKLRMARASAITKSLHYKVEFPDTTHLRSERMTQDVNGVWQIDSASIQTVPLPSLASFATSVVGTTVEFNSRGTVVNLATPLQITLTDTYNSSIVVQAWPSGQVQ
jgi:prepilin-type N-terminal cleavage/methylation domain-containing protein